ncbi:preprotein translocase subunit YajC [Verrucomicrobiota bacterium]|nr:preprotein translocase subunit YajC [Verrucomicrobiota bacterium]
MFSTSVYAFLAQASPPTQPPIWVNMVPLVLLMVVFYVAILRPQQKKAKDLATLLETLRSGDKIVSNSGIVGVVVGVKDKNVSIRSGDAKLEILKSSVAEIIERSAPASAN